MKALILAAMLALATSAPLAAQAAAQPVEIGFSATVGGKPFRCGESYSGIGTPAATIRPSDFRFYVHDLALIDAGGRQVKLQLDQDGLWQTRDVALLDFEDGSGPCRGGNPGLNAVVKGSVPPGHYTGLAFRLGLPFDLDHGDATVAASPLNFTAMFWTWASGYRFLKIDLEGDKANPARGGATGFAIHIASSDCSAPQMTERPTSCAHPNLVEVRLNAFDPQRQIVELDLARLLAGVNTQVNTPDTAPGCMSDQDDPDCAAIFHNLGLAFDGHPAGSQSVFQARPR
jgi:uncharacterized repeat protein (TIGR04052 family)